MNIHTRLRALILVTLVPVAVFGVASALVFVDKQRDTLERGLRDQVQSIMTAVDTEIFASVGPLQLLSQSPALSRDDLPAFREEALRALEVRPADWSNIIVSDAQTAAMLMNVRSPPGSPLQPPIDPETVLKTARTGKPSVSKVAEGALKRPLFGVRVPVMREGKARYVLTALVDVDVIGRLLDRRGLTPAVAVAVIDQDFRFVARKPRPDPGTDHAGQSLREALSKGNEGWERGTLLDNTPVYRAFRRSPLSGWATSVAVPESVVSEGLLGTWLLIAGFVGAAIVGLSIAWVLAGRITRPIAALARAAPAVAQGDPSAVLMTSAAASNIDEVRDLSKALHDAAVAIHERDQRQRAAERSLRDADRSKNEFLAMLGHELRNPLSSVANATRMLAYADQKPEVLRVVRVVLGRQVDHMTHLLDDLLEVGRLAGAKIRLERAPLDLGGAVDELLASWRSAGRFASHRVESTLETAWILADRVRIDQVVANLVDNALKYTPEGRRIDIDVGVRDHRARLEIRDEGEGIPADLVGRVFDLFVQGERTLAREKGGLGIGLTLAQRIVELHDGQIEVYSGGPGEGSTFIVTLPLIEAPEIIPPPAHNKENRFMTILIVEDNADARESLAALLELSGHRVAVAESGAAALEAIRASIPQIALVDIGLPDIDGFALARAIRALDGGSAIRLIALTGYGSPEDQERAIQSGFDAHLIKPLDLDALEKMLQRMESEA